MESVTNLILRRRYGDGGKTIALNAHGDVVPPGEGWTHDPYGGEIVDGKIYGRATAVSKCDIASFTFAHPRARIAGRTSWPAAWNCTSPTTKSLAAWSAPTGC